MAKLGSVSKHSSNGESDVVVSLCSIGVVICMVVAVLGIKLRWFKKRISFDQIPNGSSGSGEIGQVVLRRSSRSFQEQFCEPVVAQGIFRKKLEEDVIIERPKTLPPVRVRKSSKTSVAFGPPKKNEIPNTIVEEPVIIPPPPPPLPPSASTLSLSALGGISSQQAPMEDKVNFSESVEIIPNGNSNKEPETEPLNTEDAPISRQLSGRKQTGFTRPSDEIIAELQKLSDEVTRKQSLINEPLQPLPNTMTTDKPREKFRKNNNRPVKSNIDQYSSDHEQIDTRKLGQRRLTGIFPSPGEEIGDLTDLSDDSDSEQKSPSKVKFQVNDSDDERKTPSPEPTYSAPSINSPPILFVTQVSNDEEQVETSDSWSAIQRHRNLTKEINDQQEVSTTNEETHSVTAKDDPPKAKPDHYQDKPPKTMGDMKRNNARNDLLLNSEKDYVET